jgi:hypothetical protein
LRAADFLMAWMIFTLLGTAFAEGCRNAKAQVSGHDFGRLATGAPPGT